MNAVEVNMFLIIWLAIVSICYAEERVNLKQAIQIIKEKNYDVKISKLEIKKAEGSFIQAGLLQNPNVYLNYTGLDFGKNILYDTSNTLLSIGVSQPIELGGKRKYRKLSAKYALESTKYQWKDSTRSVIRDFVSLYFQSLADRAYVDYLEQDLKDFDQMLLIQSKRQELGFLSLIDLLKLKLYKGELEDAIRVARGTYQKDLQDMSFYLGGVYEPEEVQENMSEANINELLELSLKNRENIKAIEKQIDSINYQIKLLKSYTIPDITVNVEYDAFGVQYKPGLGFGFSINLPVFDRRQGDLLTAVATKEQLRVSLDRAIASVKTEVLKAYEDYETNLRIYKAMLERKKVMDDILERTKKAYSMGGISTLDFLDTLRTYRSFMQSFIQAKYNTLKSLHYLLITSGSEL